MGGYSNDWDQNHRNIDRNRFSLSDNSDASREGACPKRQEDFAEEAGIAAYADDCFMDPSEVAEYLRISRSTVYKLIERRQIPSVKIGRLVRVSKSELDETLFANGRSAVR